MKTVEIYISIYPDGTIGVSETNEGEYVVEKRTINVQSPGEQVKYKKLDFGDFVNIEQYRYVGGNEHYCHKVIGVSNSNGWVDVPVKDSAKETIHDQMEDVVWCVCCGVEERHILKYRISDVEKNGK